MRILTLKVSVKINDDTLDLNAVATDMAKAIQKAIDSPSSTVQEIERIIDDAVPISESPAAIPTVTFNTPVSPSGTCC
jgi:hypothetical protein